MNRPVRIRRVYGNHGTNLVDVTVPCPNQDCEVTMDVCLSCEQKVGFKIDRGGSWVACKVTPRRRG